MSQKSFRLRNGQYRPAPRKPADPAVEDPRPALLAALEVPQLYEALVGRRRDRARVCGARPRDDAQRACVFRYLTELCALLALVRREVADLDAIPACECEDVVARPAHCLCERIVHIRHRELRRGGGLGCRSCSHSRGDGSNIISRSISESSVGIGGTSYGYGGGNWWWWWCNRLCGLRARDVKIDDNLGGTHVVLGGRRGVCGRRGR